MVDLLLPRHQEEVFETVFKPSFLARGSASFKGWETALVDRPIKAGWHLEIFENLQSANSLVRKPALSLYICKLTIERWSGEIGYRHMGESGYWWFCLRPINKPS